MELTPPMRRFVQHFGEMGPRWGLSPDTCRAHALLYLADRAVTADDVAAALDLTPEAARAALVDLGQWGMAQQGADGAWDGGGEPWDKVFTVIEQRRRREIRPAIEMLRACRDAAARDGATPPGVGRRIGALLSLFEDIAAIDLQAGRLSSAALGRLVRFGGRTSRLIARFSGAGATR